MQEVDYEAVGDLGRFVILVDVTNKEGQVINLVQSHSQAPAIGSAHNGSFVTDNSNSQQYQTASYAHPSIVPAHGIPPAANGPVAHNGYLQSGNGFAHGPPYQRAAQSTYHPNQALPMGGSNYPDQHQRPEAIPPPPAPVNQFMSGTVTRNLIGTTTSTAFRLTDENGQTGLWFIFQDLSIRTEGTFRLRFDMFDLMPDFPFSAPPQEGPKAANPPRVANVHSRPFKVWSAKKFPGVIETTQLSRAFAEQGIKIPVRKNEEKKRKRARAAGEDMDDDSEGDF
jgi:hypothetical protein